MDIQVYNHIRSGGAGFYEQKRGLIAVWGKEAVPFLDGMITNDMKTLEDGQQMLAAFPNAQGRLIAVVRVLRQGDRFLLETEEATHEKLYQNLFRFTFAGDFFIEDLSGGHRYFEIAGTLPEIVPVTDSIRFDGRGFYGYFVPSGLADEFTSHLEEAGILPIDDATYETLRIESGVPKYGVDMDETTIVPELGFPEMISYTKGCYIGQEIIARIHFRGHVAKQLTGITSTDSIEVGSQLASPDGKPAGRVTSVAYSTKLEKTTALAFVRYDYLTPGTELRFEESRAKVTGLPFVE
jgi:tRNA-modifying protein YgfZ